jgi:hypothetical protein
MAEKYVILHQNEHGFVSLCEHCQMVQISFGNWLFHLEVADFKKLQESLTEAVSQDLLKTFNLPDGEKILLESPADNCYMSFTRNEFDRFCMLMEQARVMLETREILTPDA